MKLLLLLLALTTICYSIPVATPNNVLNNPVVQEQEPATFLQKDNAVQGPNDYFDVSANEVTTDPKIQDALSYGISQIINEAVQKGKAPIAEYTVTEVKKVQRQVTGAGVNYRFEVTLTNGSTTTIKATFTCFVRNSDQQRSLLAYNYQVQSTTATVSRPVEPIATAYTFVSEAESTSDQDIQTCLNFGLNEVLKKARADGNAGLDNLSTQVKSVEKQIVQENYAFYRFTVEQRNDRVNLTTTFVVQFNKPLRQTMLKSMLYKVVTARATGVIVTDDDGYTQIPLIDIQSDSVAQGCLEFGVAQVIEKALAERKVPISRYTVTTIETAAKKMVGEIYLYKFSLELGNGQGTTIKANFTIKYNAPSTNRSIAAFSYSARTVTTSR